ncbi:succinate dehydrogenase, cytochrome b556 subunit [Terasakiella pusilla]|uniref:succinate dehydrogenase, cytochrome b556 subunit n=1 Tax=Terasakiella pusilla TaxID=64973 RepID=UPI00048FB5E4|nr:succinate dehydrogenase, cytochrome b556 subunit [Terasakiella pusilla]
MTTGNRPLSPHMKIYKFPLNGLMSGSHRVTGILLSIGTLLFAYWLIAAAYGAESYETAQAFFGSWLGQLMLIGWTFCLYYHLVNGIRHLIWDMGKCLEKEDLIKTGRIGMAVTAVLTVATWIIGYSV